MKNQTFRSEVRGISRSATNISGIQFVQDKLLDGEKIYLVILSYLIVSYEELVDKFHGLTRSKYYVTAKIGGLTKKILIKFN